MTLYTASQLAKQLACTPQTITRNAQLRGIGRKISTVWLFTRADIAKMKKVLDDNYKRDFAAMGRQGMKKRWHGKEV